MPAPVRIDFQVGGIALVEKAIESVDKSLARLERNRKGASDRATRQAKTEAGAVADAHVKATEKWSKAHERIVRNAAVIAGREARRAADAETREAQRTLRATEASAKARDRIRERSALMAGRLAAQEARAEQRAQEQQTRAVEREARRRERIAQQSASMAGRLAAQQARQEASAHASARRSIDGGVGRFTGIVGGATGRVISAATNLVAGGLALGGGLTVADSVTRAFAAEKAAAALANSAFIPGQTTRPSTSSILSRASAVAQSTGVDKTELIKGMQAYTAKSADFAGAMENLPFMAQLSKASGTSFQDLSTAAGYLRTQNKDLKPEDMKAMLRDIVAQGKLGAIEISDLAKVAATTTATSAAYSGSQTDNQRKLLGLAQVAIKTSGSPEEAATTIARLSSDATKNRDVLSGLGVFDKSGRITDPTELISKVMAKTNGNLGSIQGLGFGERSIRLFQALAPTFAEAEAKKRGSGAAAVTAEMAQFTNAKYSDADVAADFANVMSTSAEKFDLAMMRVREIVEAKLVPYLDRFAERLPEIVPKVEKFVDAMGKLADFFIANPFEGIGAILIGAVVKDLAMAGIGAALKATIVNLASGAVVAGNAANGLGAGGSVATGGLTAAGAAVGGGIIGAGLGYGAISIDSARQLSNQRGVFSAATTSATTDEQRKAKIDILTKQIDEARAARDKAGPGFLTTAVGQLTGQGGAMVQAGQVEKDAFNRTIAMLQEEIRHLREAMSGNPVASNNANRNFTMSSPQRGGATP